MTTTAQQSLTEDFDGCRFAGFTAPQQAAIDTAKAQVAAAGYTVGSCFFNLRRNRAEVCSAQVQPGTYGHPRFAVRVAGGGV